MSNLYFKIPNLTGNSTSDAFPGSAGWSVAAGFSWGESNGASNDRAGKAVASSIELTRVSGFNSPYYMFLCGAGKVLGTLTLILTSVIGGKETIIFEYAFTNAIVASYQLSGESGSTPSEAITFVFEKLTSTFYPTVPGGGLGMAQVHFWDFIEETGS